MIAGFDQGVVGMKLNQTKNITIPANQAYGEINPALFTKVPISDFGNQTYTLEWRLPIRADSRARSPA